MGQEIEVPLSIIRACVYMRISLFLFVETAVSDVHWFSWESYIRQPQQSDVMFGSMLFLKDIYERSVTYLWNLKLEHKNDHWIDANF